MVEFSAAVRFPLSKIHKNQWTGISNFDKNLSFLFRATRANQMPINFNLNSFSLFLRFLDLSDVADVKILDLSCLTSYQASNI